MLSLLLLLLTYLLGTVALAADPDHDEDEKSSPTPFHIGADVSVKPGAAGHVTVGLLPFRHWGLNVAGRMTYEEEGFYYEARGGLALRLGTHGTWVLAPNIGFERFEAEWSWRSGAMVAYTKHYFETAALLEVGGETGVWYSVTVNSWIKSERGYTFGGGLFAQGPEGIGPIVGTRLKDRVALWAAPLLRVEWLNEDKQFGEPDLNLVVAVEVAGH